MGNRGDFDARKIRNICILAHVDHGKTTLADHLIAASGGGVLHPETAGRLRFMDYLDEEQRRAITMKSSSIALRYEDYSVNLIDSPGHMDFCSEVSTAARLSDGALVLVDAVEGVHIQTHAVLRQAWIEKLTPCLVLNKIDRLISELKLSPMEAHTRLLRIVHEVNGIVSAYQSEKYLSDVDSLLAGPSGDVGDENLDFLEDEEDTFQPQKGNVAFVCALDGWGFGIDEFAEFYAAKLGASVAALRKALWGPQYYNPKTKMIMGKKGLLNRADPFVEVTVSSRGEHVLAAAGEVHLERCIKDLKERFAKVSLEVSPPLVSYKETIEGEEFNPLDSLKSVSRSSEYVEKMTPNGRCVVRVQVMKLPSTLTKVLDESAELLGSIVGGKPGQSVKTMETQRSSMVDNENPIEAFKKRILDALDHDIFSVNESDKDRVEKCKDKWLEFLRRTWAFGPRQVGPNILFTPDSGSNNTDCSVLIQGSSHVSERLGFVVDSDDHDVVSETSFEGKPSLCTEAQSLESSVVSGFQLATAAGPLCDEPMWGLAFIVEACISPLDRLSNESEPSQQSEQYGMFTGQVMSAVKDACRAAVLQKKPRLVEAMYFCELNTPTEYLGPMYAVLARRRARVLKEEMNEGSPLFTVHAYVPVSESFGFADELRKGTSGGASALLVLSHWEALAEDPFFVPKTEEEIEEFGDGASVLPNTARKLIDAVRRRKGLPVEEKVVRHATKQRTLARKV
ncbi:LOW QUALITY PROTEIN: elongation factor-like GTPase 1 [Carica papaya]|uniref:LOW QUALITY PROTEIN: elongation factor-like GTPase 1 n=1 Tax=Carica papaya TaxID=3649 RepID=UPI000B8D02E5|nr:LOW QUALITY PROTEIN: elongation factor-like GTPase 1 [Carica papaya]